MGEVQEHTLCGICLEGVLAKDQIFLRGCHVHNGDFHEDCVAKWVHEQTEEQKVEPRCPTCRQHIPKGQTRDLMVRGIALRYPDGRPQEENPFSVEFVGGFQARRAARRADIERMRCLRRLFPYEDLNTFEIRYRRPPPFEDVNEFSAHFHRELNRSAMAQQ